MRKDQEYDSKWLRKHGAFKGVNQYVRLMKSGNVKGERVEVLFWQMVKHAPQCSGELIAAFHEQEDARMRADLLEVMAWVPLPEAFPLFAEYIRSDNESLRSWSRHGLEQLNTKEARRVLWEAGFGSSAP